MGNDIKINSTSATRVTTGAVFSLNIVPLEFSLFECSYNNPKHGVNVGFRARWIYGRIERLDDGAANERQICFGMILVNGELEKRMEQTIRETERQVDADALIRDCYELITCFIRNENTRKEVDIDPHIYVVSERGFGTFEPEVPSVGPEAITNLNAERVF